MFRARPMQVSMSVSAAVIAAALIAGPAGASPQAPAELNEIAIGARDATAARHLNMGVGKSIIIDLPRDAAEVFVGNPKVADAVVRSPRRLYVLAVGNGQTTVFVMDAAGKQIATLEIDIGRDVQELSRILKTAMPHADVAVRTINDTIILTGAVDSAGEAQAALDIAKGFVSSANAGIPGAAGAAGAGPTDGKVINSITIRGRDQVTLKVTIAEVQRTVLKQLGVTATNVTGGWGKFIQQNPFTLNAQTLSTTAASFGGSQLGATLQAFERNGVARILSEPNVTAMSGESAKFTAGGEVPVPSGYDSQHATLLFVYKPYGVTLNFTPLVLSEGRILLRIATEVTEIDPNNSVNVNTIAGINVPAFLTRKNETSVELPSGGSIMSAGLIQTKSRQIVNGLPALMNLPILGALFRSRDYQREETELMVIVTPYLSKPVGPAEIVKPTDGFSDATDGQTWLLGRLNRIYSTTHNVETMENFKGRVGFIND